MMPKFSTYQIRIWGLSSNGAENRVNASSLLDRLSILLGKKHIGTRVMPLPHVLQGHRLAEPAPKSPPRRHGEQRATLMQVMVFIFFVPEDV
jgi:hypothetical protein